MLKWLDNIPLGTLVMITVLLGLAPFSPEPHLWQKLKMLFSGELAKPIDILDLFMHASPLVLLSVKLIRMQRHKGNDDGT